MPNLCLRSGGRLTKPIFAEGFFGWELADRRPFVVTNAGKLNRRARGGRQPTLAPLKPSPTDFDPQRGKSASPQVILSSFAIANLPTLMSFYCQAPSAFKARKGSLRHRIQPAIANTMTN